MKSQEGFSGSIKISNPSELMVFLLVEDVLYIKGSSAKAVLLRLPTEKPRQSKFVFL
jgi:hypothetical protein